MRGLMIMAAAAFATTAFVAEPALADNTKAVRAVGSELTVLSDGRGHYLVLKMLDPQTHNPNGRERKAFDAVKKYVYYGNGRTFYQLGPQFGRRTDPHTKKIALRVWFPDPRSTSRHRSGGWGSAVISDGKSATVECGGRAGAFSKLGDRKAARLIARAKFLPTKWKRKAHSLARDFRGKYYYVDMLRKGMGYRLFIGRRGRMKKQRLADAIQDTVGTLFVIKTGSLQISAKARTARWISLKNVETKLTPVPIQMNRKLIYSQLGIYDGKRFGTPCDDH